MYKYGVGLLELSLEDLETVSLGEFMIRVESKLLLEDERVQALADHTLPFHAIFTSFIMQSSGNMKKTFDPLKTAESLYPSEKAWGSKDEGTGTGKYDYTESKEKLLSSFELED